MITLKSPSYISKHTQSKVELVHNYSGDFHHSKDVAEMVMKVEFQDHIEPIVNNPDLGGGRQSQTSQSWLEYPGQDPEQWETEMPQLISATIDHVYELLEAAGEETTVEAVWRYLIESAAVCKQAPMQVTFVVKLIMILGQVSIATLFVLFIGGHSFQFLISNLFVSSRQLGGVTWRLWRRR